MKRARNQAEIEAILTKVAARRLTEEEAYSQIRALAGTQEKSSPLPDPTAARPGPGDALESPTRDARSQLAAANPQPAAASAAKATSRLSVQIEGYLRARVADVIKLAPEMVSADQPFLDLGFDSASLIIVVERMEAEIGTELCPTLFFQYQTIRELAGHLGADHGPRFAAYFETQATPASSEAAAPLSGPQVAVREPQEPSPAAVETGGGDIAVIGMSGRFAGSRNLPEFWRHLRDSTDLVGDIPADHWDFRPWFDARPDEIQRTYCRWGSFLSDIDKFDPLFFHMSPREADITDPQLRHLLEVLYETTEDAGYASRIWGTKTGMFVGVCFKDYWDEIVRRRIPVGAMEFPGCAMSFMANRPSYFFDLHGPSVPVDDACSSSLVALHMACKALQRGECEMAFASGINVVLSPLHYVYFSALGALSPTGRCRSFTDRADGYVPGEGIVSVLLKPLDRAVRDGDNIHAVIKGSAVNHGGRANNPTSPRTQLQTEVLRSAWSDARIDPGTLDYIEAHGTGTLLGDPIEVDALKRAFRHYTSKEAFCALGSAKANIGHTEAAAGLAGLVKVILSMKHGTIPTMPGFSQPNPYLKLEGSPLYINTRNLPWPTPIGRQRRAGVSSFGIGGAYAHVVVEDYADPRLSEPGTGPYLFVLSAHTESQLKAGTGRFRRFLEGEGATCAPQDLCHTLQVGRQPMAQRLAVVFRDPRELVEALADYEGGRSLKGPVFSGRRKPNGEHPPQATLRSWWTDRDLGRLGEAWARGAEVPWTEFPAQGAARRISLPFYAFEQRRHWLPETGREGPDWESSDRLHALLDRVVPSFEGPEFLKAFRGDEPFLRDHRVKGEQLLPGVVQLEMALAAAVALGRGDVIGLSDVTWKRPVLIDGSGRECRIRLKHDGGVTWSLECSGETHTEGRVDFSAGAIPEVPSRVDLDAVRARCVRRVESGEVYGHFAATGIDYGETLRPVAEVWTGPGEALARLECAPGDAVRSSTVLLDGLLQASIALFPQPQADAAASLPYAADSVRILRAPSGTCHAHVRAVLEPVGGGDSIFDMVLTDSTGAVLVQLSGIRMKQAGEVRGRPAVGRSAPPPATPIERESAGVAIQSYVPRWKEAAAATPQAEGGSTLIFRHAQDIGLSERLAARLGEGSVSVVHLGRGNQRINERVMAIDCRSAEDFARVIAEHPNLGTVYFLGGLPTGVPGEIIISEVANIKDLGVFSFLRLVQALPQSVPLQIRVVTRDVHPVGSTLAPIDPFGALVAGAAQVAAKENPDWRVSCVDLSSRDDPAIDLITQERGADIAIRRGKRFERALHPVDLPRAEPSSLPLRKSGVYLLVGGLGGLGLVVGRYLGEHFQGRLVLVGRREPSAEQKDSIADLERRGCEVLYCRADASDEPSMREVVSKAHERFGAINGVIHSALILRDQSMAKMEPEAFNSVLASKLEGSLVLEAVTRDEPLDFLLFFSSANSILANAGQSNYVAGCAFQDAFAERLRRQGRPAQTINWGLWGDVGIMAGTDQEARLERLGIYPIRVAEGREQWTRILASGLGQVIPVKMLPAVFESCGIHLADGGLLLAAKRESILEPVARSLATAGAKERAAAEACLAGMQGLDDFCAEKLFAVLGGMGAIPSRAGLVVDESFPADWVPRHGALWPTLLGILTRAGFLERSGVELRVASRLAVPEPALPAASDYGELAAFHDLARVCLDHFQEIVRGGLLATDVLFPDASMDRLERIYSGNAPLDLFNHLSAESVAAFLRSHWRTGEGRQPVRILEIGAGTGGTSRFILEAIARAVSEEGPGTRPVEFIYTDISRVFVDHGQERFASSFPFARFHVLNIESDPAGQGIDLNSVDLVVAANVLHATRSIDVTLAHAKRLLRRNGLLVLNELTQASNFTSVTFGLLDGWWLSSDPELRIPGSPLLSVEGWRGVLGSCGFRRISVFRGSTERQSLIVAESDGLVQAEERVTAPAAVPHAGDAESAPVPLEAPHSGVRLEQTVRLQVAATLRLSPEEVDGDRRFSEYGVDSILAVELVKRVNRTLGTRLKTTALFDYSSVNDLAGHLRTIVTEVPPSPAATAAAPAAAEAVRGLVLRGPGEVGDLRLEPIAVADPKAGEIQIAVRAFGLNFGDWLCVRGLYPFMPDYPFVAGLEVSGQVIRVGPGVTRFRIGDAVIGLTGARFGGQAERVTVDQRLAVAKPLNVSFEDAAAYPVAFMTAHEALEVARLRAGETILIQNAAGGTGLMAVQLALERGAKIYATAGSPEKLDYLRRIGVSEVINYRDQDFALEVRRRTGGRGVDVVLNMLSGDAIQKGLDLLGPGGRYLEIALGGLKAAKGIDLSNLDEGQSIHFINLLHRLKSRPDEIPADLEVMARHLAGGRVKPTVSKVFEFDDLAQAYRHLESRRSIGKVVVSVRAPAQPSAAEEPGPRPEHREGEIAIIGMAGRFPGADDLCQFWSNLAAGRSSIEEVPPGRWPMEGFYDANPNAPDRSISKWGGFLSQIECFDPLFFNLSGREAERMDPQQRLFLEEAWHALEDSGYSGRSMSETRCGLFVGVGGGDYDQKLKSAGVPADGYVFTGNQPSILAARLAYFLNLKGPALAVDTACSSSLVAIHLACQALRQGEIDSALAGGVFINTTPAFHILCSKAGMLSPSGACRTFDQAADGFVPGEGVGVILLKPLGRALADGDRIYAVIKGSGVNQDGKTNGITAPSAESQSALEREVYERSGVDPSSLSYVETHGTGTKLGDPIEVEGLTKAFRAYTRDSGFCALGSVKTNIGHAATAAGIASVLKVVLSLEHEMLPPSLNFETENEHLLLRETPFFVNGAVRDWTARPGKPRRAAVSSFGFSGTNCHIVLEEAPAPPRVAGSVGAPAWIFTLSAKTEAALGQKKRDLLAWLTQNPQSDLSAVSQTLTVGRDHFENRFAVVAADSAKLSAALSSPDEGTPAVSVDNGHGNAVGRALEALRRPVPPEQHRAALETIAHHYRTGAQVDWTRFHEGSSRQRVSLPGYPFARDRFWVPETPAPQLAVSAVTRPGDTILFLTGKESFVRDHVISGRQIVPAVVFMEWAGSAAANAMGGPLVRLENLAWTSPLPIPDEGGDVAVVISPSTERARIEVRSSGRPHFSAEAVRGQGAELLRKIDVGQIKRRCGSAVRPETLYELFRSLGVEYGTTFKTVREISSGDDEALTVVELARSDGTPGSFALPPGLMDGALQPLMLLVQRAGLLGKRPFVPVALASLAVRGHLPHLLLAHASLSKTNAEGLRFDIDMATPEGQVVVELRGLCVREWREKTEPQAAREATAVPQGSLPGQAEAEAVLAGFMATELRIPVASLRPADPFENLGIDSVMVDHFNFELEKRLGPISRTLFFEYQNLRDLAGYFLRRHAPQLRAWMDSEAGSSPRVVAAGATSNGGPDQRNGSKGGSNGSGANGGHASGTSGKALQPVPEVPRKGHVAAADRDIAIVGIAGRFPRARDMAEFWENLRSGRDCITEVPRERWDPEKWYDPDPSKEGKIYAKWGGFIDNVDRFDPLFFKISPQEAELMDPQERQFLEVAFSALEDAGYTPEGLRDSSQSPRGLNVGVFVGVMWGDYQLYGAQAGDPPAALPRSAYWSIANRVSYSFDFQGPSLAIDTACSASLTAIHLACESLQRGHCRAALAGGVNLSLHPNKYRQLCQLRFGSTDGRCRSFGAGGDGYVPGEGVGAVLLKTLEDAERDGDDIRAVIKATGCNHGGKTNGYSVPNPNAQTHLIADVLERSGVVPRSISFVEAHGTGTALGDPIEISGLTRAFEEFTDERQFCSIGSAKSNIGHLEAAAGVAAVAKVLLQMKHRQLAPSLHSASINPNIRFEETPFRLQRELAAWKRPVIGGVGQPLRAAISSFGAGGSNANLILEEYTRPVPGSGGRDAPELIALSAADLGRLRKRASQLMAFLGSSAGWRLADVAYTLRVGRRPLVSRLAFVAASAEQLVGGLAAFLNGEGAHIHVGHCGNETNGKGVGQVPAPRVLDAGAQALDEAARAWVCGEPVEWRLLATAGAAPRRVSLPTYPFDGERYWVPGVPGDDPNAEAARGQPAADLGHLGEKELDARLLELLGEADEDALESVSHWLPVARPGPSGPRLIRGGEHLEVTTGVHRANPADVPSLRRGQDERIGIAEPALGALSPARVSGAAQDEVIAAIEGAIGRLLKLRLGAGDRKKPFTDFGLDSIGAVKLASELRTKLAMPVTPALFATHPSIDALARELTAEKRKGGEP